MLSAVRPEHTPAAACNRAVVRGSFRDPSGFVFVNGGTLYRQVNHSYRPHYDRLIQSGLAAHLVERRMLVAHEEVLEEMPDSLSGYKVIRPERVPFVSYPYEWCFSQLRDAALTTLRIQMAALKFGMSLKDASAYNIQFLRGRPVLIDTLSFEEFEEGQPWVAYRQFCQHFVAPLAVMASRDIRLGQLMRSFVDGLPLDFAAALLPRRTWLRPSLALHVHVHARAQRKYSASQATRGKTPTISRAALVGILDSLARAVTSVRWEPRDTEWADYYNDTNYSDTALLEKERLVARMIDDVAPTTAWDLGANNGRFSRLVSDRGIHTVAFDADPAAVEQNYRRSVAGKEAHLLPLLCDLTNPSPSLGWAGEERRSLAERGPADLILALALVHHLAIANNVPLAYIAEFFAGIARHLIVEFVPKTDSQVQRMLRSRVDVFDTYTREGFEQAFTRFFSVNRIQPIRGTDRVLYSMRCR